MVVGECVRFGNKAFQYRPTVNKAFGSGFAFVLFVLFNLLFFAVEVLGVNIMNGAIIEKGENFYTHMKAVFGAIKNAQVNYNWLITECDCYPQTVKFGEKLLRNDYCWISGEDLTSMIGDEDFQWIWAVLSGFDKSVPLEKILQYDLPHADGYAGFWKNPVTIQHPLAGRKLEG